MKKLILLFLFFDFLAKSKAQLPVVNLPTIAIPTQTIYLAPNGNDLNPGTQLLPKKTFFSAADAINFGTPSVNGGNSYGEIVLLEGDYYPIGGNGFGQYEQFWRKKQSGRWVYKNISLRGQGNVTIYGDSLSTGVQMIYLTGSKISVKNINLKNCKLHGVYFFGSLIKHHGDVLVENVTVDGANEFGIFIAGYDRVWVKNCHTQNTCLSNKNSATCNWASALRTDICNHVTFNNNIVNNNWGEGINTSLCRFVNVYDNTAFDNYSVNIYVHSASKAVYKNNLVYNTDNTFWNACFNPSSSAVGISISNELTYTDACFGYFNSCGTTQGCFSATDYNNPIFKQVKYYQIEGIYVFNNIVLNSGIDIWDAFSGIGNYGYLNNIFVENNTIIGKDATINLSSAPLGFNFGTPFVYVGNIKIRNNMISYNPDLVNKVMLNYSVGSGICNGTIGSKITFSGNAWKQKPLINGLNFFQDTTLLLLPKQVDFNDLSTINPNSSNSNLTYAKPRLNYIVDDFYHNPRKLNTNCGAIELISNNLRSEVENKLVKSNIRIYPNPNDGKFNFETTIEGNVRIFNSLGLLIFETSVNEGNNEINFQRNIPSGVYFVRFEGEISKETLKIVIEKKNP